MSIRIVGIDKHFGHYHALRELSLDIAEGEMIGLLGPSGSGKTTLLRVIAGLEEADRGQLFLADREVSRLPVQQRQVGFVFQQYALFRHLTVLDNVCFGLDILPFGRRPPRAEVRRRGLALLERVQLAHLAQRYPDQLSGGQRQRVALARALATEPQVLLLDEPFGALDAKVRKELRQWLRALHGELRFTGVFVTHDQDEALELSDRVVVMSAGAIEQVDAPGDLYARPASRFVFDFLGDNNVLSGTLADGRLQQGLAWVAWPGLSGTGAAELYVRSHEMLLQPGPAAHCHLPLRVIGASRVGAQARLTLLPQGWESKTAWEWVCTDPAARLPDVGTVLHAVPRAGALFRDGDPRPHPVAPQD